MITDYTANVYEWGIVPPTLLQVHMDNELSRVLGQQLLVLNGGQPAFPLAARCQT